MTSVDGGTPSQGGTPDEVLGIVAHDLRTPLGAIRIYASLLAEDQRLNAGQRERLLAILRATAQMEHLVGDLLEASRAAAGTLRVEPRAVEPAAVVQAVRELVGPQAGERQLRLECACAAALPALYADEARLVQALANLLANAVQFTPAGGLVELRVERLGDEVLFTVRDTGVGMPAECLVHLFDHAWHAGRERRAAAGLGLRIAQGIVDAHGGRIWAQSEPGRGSSVFVALPGASAAPAQPDSAAHGPGTAADAAEGRPRPAPVRVLLVDDHVLFRHGLERLLERQPGVAVVGQASSGEEAVLKTRLLRPDVVVMDLVMPGIGGVEATRRIVAAHPQARVLALTADTEDGSLWPVLEAGGSGFVRKTKSYAELLRAIATVAAGEVFLDPAASRVLRDAYRRPQTATDARLGVLSAKEREVIAGIAAGYSSAEIAKQLFLSPQTVNTYRSRAMRKLGLHHRAELVHLVVRAGLLAEP